MPGSVFIYVNGIMTFPGAADNWTGRAVTWTHIHSPFKAEKIEYYAGPVSRVLGQRRRAHKLIRTLEYYKSWNITLVGHSNGCDVILDALREVYDAYRINNLHLISAACYADCYRNGLNALKHTIGHVNVWIAKNDWPLRLAGYIPARLLGYGTLGLKGPVNPQLVCRIIRRDFGHSGWFVPGEFDETMQRIVGRF